MSRKRLAVGLMALAGIMSMPVRSVADGWILISDSTVPEECVTLANGELGLTLSNMPFGVERILSGGSYQRATPQSVSRIMEVINPLGVSMNIDGNKVVPVSWNRILDLKKASLTTEFTVQGAEVSYTFRALRNMPHAVMLDATVKALKDGDFEFVNSHSVPDGYTDTATVNKTVWCEDGGIKVMQTSGNYNSRRNHLSASSVFIVDSMFTQSQSDRIHARLKEGQTARFALVASIVTNDSFDDVWNESDRQVIFAKRQGLDSLISGHEKEWADLWESDIIIPDDEELQKIVRTALFNLYSSIRSGSGRSVPPMGLTSQSYNGHIFWDAELWIFPVLLAMHPELAKEMLTYRYDNLNKARRKARAYGYEGAMFPWESDDLGEESTPTHALTGPMEHHVTADVAIAAWNYYLVTQDYEWLREIGYPLLKESADFWVSRAERNEDGSCSILNVVGADEYAIGVDDNAFTNGAAKLALEYAVEAAAKLGVNPNPHWSDVAAGLRIERFEDGVTKEYADYAGEMIKQADANLLGYPLGLVDSSQQLKDMAYYIDKIDPVNGPAMSHAIFSVQYARAGEKQKAYEMFERSFLPNLREPFYSFAETATSANPYFMTGAGAILQALIYGFGGYEITPRGLERTQGSLPSPLEDINIVVKAPFSVR